MDFFFEIIIGLICLNIDLSRSNFTDTYDSSGKNLSKLEIKVLFLGHLHHPVSQVGKGPHHPVNLKKVQALIDDAHNTLDMSNVKRNIRETVDDDRSFGETLIRDKRRGGRAKSTHRGKSNHRGKSRKFEKKKRNVDEITKRINNAVANVQDILNGDRNVVDQEDDYDQVDDKEHDQPRKIMTMSRMYQEATQQKPEKSKDKDNRMTFIKHSHPDWLTFNQHGEVSPEQEDDINKFIKNLEEPPQVFRFDVDQFMKTNLTENFITTAAGNDERSTTERIFFEFPTTPPPGCGHRSDQLIVFDDKKYIETKPPNNRKRDVLTQRIKAISNMMKMNTILDEPAANRPQQRSDRMVNQKETNQDTDFIDNYYLLNDGTLKFNENVKSDPQIDPVSINIDLDLNNKFRDLKLETDQNFYAEERRRDAEEENLRKNQVDKGTDAVAATFH